MPALTAQGSPAPGGGNQARNTKAGAGAHQAKRAIGARQTAANLKGQLANAKSPEERNALLARIAEAEGRATKAETESIGVDCSKREVPAYLLADLRVVAP